MPGPEEDEQFEEEFPGIDTVPKIGPLLTLPVGNIGASIPENGFKPDGGPSFLAEIIPAESAEKPFPRKSEEPKAELESRGDEGYPPFIPFTVKLAHVMIVLLA